MVKLTPGSENASQSQKLQKKCSVSRTMNLSNMENTKASFHILILKEENMNREDGKLVLVTAINPDSGRRRKERPLTWRLSMAFSRLE